ncbi:hypothetical protein VC83_02891 [Pseudogymnoascus destructans]|uniref:Uncharacterized protein n=1 Tax=Pseudogymnoascus destructans TaxID=655981 RepID=A0A177AFD4_9PEZI|nr:uncharacterized protein VC83_02891 [Pseudogymnoascus destructans]OAF60122.1 hypothetical protein VC83_02891 [Pseudogymnoascus destructans]
MATKAVESLSSSLSTTTISPGRRPYTGSCGYTKYLTLPPPIISANPPSPSASGNATVRPARRFRQGHLHAIHYRDELALIVLVMGYTSA